MAERSPITTHILDTSAGSPASGVTVTLYRLDGKEREPLSEKRTNNDGRIEDFLAPDHELTPGEYQLNFQTEGYFAQRGVEFFYPEVVIQFFVANPTEHYHVPLLLNPYGYTTYRGS